MENIKHKSESLCDNVNKSVLVALGFKSSQNLSTNGQENDRF